MIKIQAEFGRCGADKEVIACNRHYSHGLSIPLKPLRRRKGARRGKNYTRI